MARQRTNRRLRRGVSLIELLIVMAIIGTMVGLLLPAVHLVLQASRRAACDDHLRQLGLAMQGYLDTTRYFYPYPPAPDRPTGWAIAILPYMEESNLVLNFDPQSSLSAPVNLDAARNTPRMFICQEMEHFPTELPGIDPADYWFVADLPPPGQPRRALHVRGIVHAPAVRRPAWCASPEVPRSEYNFPRPHEGAFGF